MASLLSAGISLGTKVINALLFDDMSINDVVIDACLKQNHNRSSKITHHVVEDGVTISDHIIQDPITITLDFHMGNVVPLISRLSGRAIGAFTGSNSMLYGSQNMFDKLEDAWKNKRKLTIKTDFMTYTDMYITDLSRTTQAPYSETLDVSVTLEQLYGVNIRAKSIAGASGVDKTVTAWEATKSFLEGIGF